ncbi:type VII secretion protein EccB [Actinacidiphila acididurans]|uniref:Type VII secretion protein EccB n=1 Tax=Actinacidiphila acididurans TaxID=2784346 RepID=A0ABS2TKY4_9ACTN|nr:type VII secretion protein EccB [Actinacidiphila acididurans]MBM9503995.1 type VII secretion protein EccB [Actinacidiphila acididurans]
MASRKDQLNAYNFARRRTVAAFLQPSPTGSEEGAPRPLRALGPSLVVGALALAAFGAWGLLQPAAPSGWDTPGSYVIVGSESTTRYVVLKDTGPNGKPGPAQLHPVLNFASAKLLLDPDKGQVIKVKESVLDSGTIRHGATIGIPYAPDRLPSPQDAGTPKDWAVCDRPGAVAGTAPDQAVFVLAAKEAVPAGKRMRLTGNQVLYVRDRDSGTEWLVDAHGTRYELGGPQGNQASNAPEMQTLRTTLFGQSAQPQPVTKAWLNSLNPGSPIVLPNIPGLKTTDASGRKVGTVLEATSAAGENFYVVQQDGVASTTAFAALLIEQEMGQAAPVRTAVPSGVVGRFTGAALDWPALEPHTVNVATAGGATPTTVACSVLAGPAGTTGRLPLEVWAGADYPATIVNGATSAYVTPGTGLLYVEVTGNDPTSGTLYLVTDTGLRYAVPRNNDSTAATPTPAPTPGGTAAVNLAQTRLGYGGVTPKGIPLAWSEFLPKGPTLDTESAMQAQGS